MTRSQNPDAVRSPVLPYDVRYALRYRGAEIGAEEVLTMATTMPSLCVYGVSKLLQKAVMLERLPRVLDMYMFGRPGNLASVASTALHEVKITQTMPKLAEHSRKYVATHDAYRRSAGQTQTEPAYLLAHSTLVGLRPFAENRGKPFGILFEPSDGYANWLAISVDPVEKVVSGVRTAGQLPSRVTIIDDIAHSGATRQAINDQYPEAQFVTVFGQV